jgi:D-aspartate ligase
MAPHQVKLDVHAEPTEEAGNDTSALHRTAWELAAVGDGGAIVAGGSHGTVGIARSLGRRGIPVWVLQHDKGLPEYSKYVQRSPDWPANEEAQIERLLQLADRYHLDGWTLFPAAEADVELFSRHWSVLNERFRVTTPPWEVTRFAFDKRLTYQRCNELGIDCPWTKVPSTREELFDIVCQFPAILKPAYRRSRNAFTDAKAWRVDDRASLLQRFEEATQAVGAGSVLLQEMIPGGGESQYSYAALCHEGKPVASLVARRTRQYPVDFGYTSTFVETLDRPEVEDAAVRFLESINYSGLVEVEFKYDRRDQRYKLLDVNPRVWTWHMLGQRAGVDFPYLMWLQAHRQTIPQLRGRTGVRWVLGVRDFVAAMTEISRGKLTLAAYLRSLRPPLEFGLFALDDIKPVLACFPAILRRLFRRRTG